MGLLLYNCIRSRDDSTDSEAHPRGYVEENLSSVNLKQ